MQDLPQWRWLLDEVFVRINGEVQYLWRADDHEGEALEAFVTKRRDRKAALHFLRKAMKRHGRPEVIVTDCLRSYRAAMKVIGTAHRQQTGRWRIDEERTAITIAERKRLQNVLREMRASVSDN